jgi:hypothetical protein
LLYLITSHGYKGGLKMGTCKCGFSTDPEKNCNGTHKVVKAVREQVAKEIEEIDLGGNSQVNGLGMRMLAAEVARGKK